MVASNTVGSRVLFFADTPLQVFNAAMLAEQFSADIASDILLVDQFEDCVGISRRLDKWGCFGSVYRQAPLLFSSPNDRRLKNSCIHFGKHFSNLNYLGEVKYDQLFLACPTPLSNEVLLELRNKNPELTVKLYEDGTGSYNGNILRGVSCIDPLPNGCEPNTLKARIQVRIFRALGKGRTSYMPKALYLYRPDLALPDYRFPVYPLCYSRQCSSTLKKVFKCDSSALEAADIVILDSVRREGEEDAGSAAIDGLLSSFCNSRNEVAFKVHPRSERVPDLAKDLTLLKGFWELQCAECNMDSKVLVGVASSAMLSPALMFGKEPTLVFLYELLPSIDESQRALFRSIYESAKSVYLDKGRVIVPKTMEEASEVMSQIKVTTR